MTPTFEFLYQAVNKLNPLTEQEWSDFAERLTVKNFNKGDFLIQQGTVENYVYFLNHGATRNYFVRDGKEFTVDFHFTGEFVTAYYSLITREPSAVYIEILEPTEAVVISHADLTAFYTHHHGERIGRKIAEYQYVRRLRKEMDLLALTAEERYGQLLKRNPKLIRSLSVKHLSGYLGIQPESLSRIRNRVVPNVGDKQD